MSANPKIVIDDLAQQKLMPIYLSTLRQRFKAEVNRLTQGGIQQLLGNRADAADLGFLLTYTYAWHWLREHVAEPYRAPVLATFKNPKRLFLMRLLVEAPSARDFIAGYAHHWLHHADNDAPVQLGQFLNLLHQQQGDVDQLIDYVLNVWNSFGLFVVSHKVAFSGIAKEERERYGDMLGEADLQRLALVDALDDTTKKPQRFDKLGVIPVMGCPQTCRHCMFIWRPLKPSDPKPDKIYQWINDLTDSVLFTGGDLTKHLDAFYNAIHRMRQVKNFAILLNGDFADDMDTTQKIMGKMAAAIKARPTHWPKAHVLLQISFDEFHQEVIVDKHGKLKERIPVAKIANIVECAPRYAKQIQVALLHKQTGLNFSMDVLQKGVFARLVTELGERGHQVKVLSSAPSARLKVNPQTGEAGRVLKDASFILSDYPEAPILLTSSTIDGYGRASLLEEGETVKERVLLQQVLDQGADAGERFDIDLMFWFNGWATLFNAVHICLGDLYKEGVETILARQRKDPLSHALHFFDRRLLEFYAEIRPDLQQLIDAATGPHHLFHSLTEEGAVRLHMTRRLIETSI